MNGSRRNFPPDTMYWKDVAVPETTAPADVVDLAFEISCRMLPADHAYPLWQALYTVLPWLEAEPGVGVHPIHGAESGNGWMRPDGPQALLQLSRRTKLMLRVPRRRIADARALSGTTLDLGGYEMLVGEVTVRDLNPLDTLFSRHVALESDDDEGMFMGRCAQELGRIGITPSKMLCGRETRIGTPEGGVRTRSLMLAELTARESMQLQLSGLGPGRRLGCGLFVGHKDIKPVKQGFE
ncbi:MAG: type I-MYXAN CRISPR-associated protein Cas6/Cmx6 [Acidiferrobacteraceae bacterium]